MGLIIFYIIRLLSQDMVENFLNEPGVHRNQKGKTIIAHAEYDAQTRKLEVHIRDKQLHGPWMSYFPNQQLCDSGRMHQNLPDGEWKLYYPGGQLRAVRNYSANKYRYIQQDLQRRNNRNFRYAISRRAYANESVQQYFVHDFQQSDQSLSLMARINANLFSSGDFYNPPFTAALHHGRYLNYGSDGQLIDSGAYNNGLRHGYWLVRNQDEFIRGKYDQGNKTGQWRHFDSNGLLLYTEYFSVNGKRIHAHRFLNN